MITLRYRLLGDVNYPILTKVFDSETELEKFINNNKNVLLLEIERKPSAAYKYIFGG